MAKVISVVGTLSGSIGATTYSHNKGGPYIKRRGVPTTPASAKQAASHAILSYLSGQWSSALGANQRAQWNDRGSTVPVPDTMGTMIQLTGHQWFVSTNARLIALGLAYQGSPPVTPIPDPLVTLTVTLTALTGISAAFTVTPLLAGQHLALWMTLPRLAGADPNQAQARLVGYSAAAATSPQTFVSPYPFSTGQSVNFYGGIVDATGQASTLIKYRVAAVP